MALSVWAHSIAAVTMSIGMPNQTVGFFGTTNREVSSSVTMDVCT